LEDCRRFYETKRYGELLVLAEPHLGQATTGMDSALAELWSLVGRSRYALNDVEGARAAFEEAIRYAPDSDRATHQHHLAGLAALVGHRFLSRVERASEIATGEERIVTLQQAARWFKQGVMASPENEDLALSLARALKGLWAAYGQTATALLQRREFHGARRLLREALSDEDFPADRRDAFKDLLASTFTSEVEQLAAQAIRNLDEEREQEALALLQRAEGILTSIPTEAIVKERLEEVNRRLWWGYTKLGLRRVEAEEFEEALEPLFHALQIDEVDSERQGKTLATVIQALNHVIQDRATRIHQLMVEGKLETAVREGQWLRAVVEEGRELGVREEELAAALALARPIMARLDQAQTGSPP
jgi:tetratricopeptide (TPR) repeat protein